MAKNNPTSGWHVLNALLGTVIWLVALIVIVLGSSRIIMKSANPKAHMLTYSVVMMGISLIIQFFLMLFVSFRSSKRTRLSKSSDDLALRQETAITSD